MAEKRVHHSYNVPGLFHRLCTSVLTHSLLQHSSICEFSFHEPSKGLLHDGARLQSLAHKLMLLSMDILLLRKWEWMVAGGYCISHSLGVTLSLYCQGKPDQAKTFSDAVNWLIRDPPCLKEPENILKFLFLLSSPNNNCDMQATLPMQRTTYSYYPR